MPETKLLEQIDRDTNKNIDFQELKKALDEGFFDKKTGKIAHTELVKQELQKRERSDQLKNTCDQTLLDTAEELMKKIQNNTMLSEQDIKLFKLSYKLGYIHLANVTMILPLLEGTDGTLSLGVQNIISIINPRYNAYPAIVKRETPRVTKASTAVTGALNKRMETTNMLLPPEQKRTQYETIIKLASAYLHYQESHGEDTEAASKTLQEFISKCNQPGGIEKTSSSELYVAIGGIFSGALFDKNGTRDSIVSLMTDNSQWLSPVKAKETTMAIVTSIRNLDKHDATLSSWFAGFTYESGEGISEVLTDNILHLRVREDVFGGVGAKEFNGTMQKIESMISLDAKGDFSGDMQKLLALFPEIQPVDTKEFLKNYSYKAGDSYGGSKTLDNPLSAENIAKGKRLQALEAYLGEMHIPFGNSPEVLKIRKEMTKALMKMFEKMQLSASHEKQKIKETLLVGYTKEQKNVEKNILEAKKLLKQKGIDDSSPTGKAYIKYFEDQRVLYTDLLAGKSISMEGVNGNQTTISIEQIAESQVRNYQSIYLAETLPKAIGSMLLQAYPTMVNSLKETKQPLTSDEQAIRLMADIKGIGDYWSDKKTNVAVNVSKELVINIALIAVSGGIANIAAKSALAAVQKGAELINAANVVVKVGKYSQVASKGLVASWKTSRALTIADLTVEGATFHATHTTLNAARAGESDQLLQKLNPFGHYSEAGNEKSSSEDYLRSVVFMGVMKYFGGITNSMTQKIAGKKLENLNTPALQDKLLANIITLPAEFVGMQGADVAVNIAFGENVKLAPEDLMQTLAMVVGLRIAHMGTGLLNALSKKIESKTIAKGIEKSSQGNYTIKILSIEDSGEKQQVKYLITDKESGNVIDEGVVSSLGKKNNLSGVNNNDISSSYTREEQNIDSHGMKKENTPGEVKEALQKAQENPQLFIDNLNSNLPTLKLQFNDAPQTKEGQIIITSIIKNGNEVGTLVFKLYNEKFQIQRIGIKNDYTRQGIAENLYKELNKAGNDMGVGNLYSDTHFLDSYSRVFLDGKELTENDMKNLTYTEEQIQQLIAEGRLTEIKERPAQHLWDKLVREGKAEKLADGGYKFKNNGVESAIHRSPIETENQLFNKKYFIDHYKSFIKIAADGGRNIGLYKFSDAFVKVVKAKRAMPIEQVARLQEATKDLPHVFVPREVFNLAGGEQVIVMNIAEGVSCDKLTPEQIDAIPAAHFQAFEKTMRTLSERGIQTDLTKRSNFIYSAEKGFQFIDIEGVALDGSSTNKFFTKDGQQYYYSFERYPVFPKKYVDSKTLFTEMKSTLPVAHVEIRSVNNFSQEKIETIIGRKMKSSAEMERIQKVHDMNFEREIGRDGILPPGLYVNENGTIETNFTNKQLVAKRQELMKDGMFTQKEANALLENYVCGTVMPADLVVQFLGNKIARFLKNVDKNMTPQQAQAKIESFMKIFTKFEKYSLSDEYTDVYGDVGVLIGETGGSIGQFIELLTKTRKIATHGKTLLYQIQDIVKLQLQGLDKQAVKENAQLPDVKRGDKGMEIVKTQGLLLSYYDEQILRDAISEAHPIGRGEPGKNGLKAEIYNYTNKQLWQKMQVLYKAIKKINEINRKDIISAEQGRVLVKELLKKGICGEVE